MESLDTYVDALVRSRLRQIGYECSDLYELFALIVDKADSWLRESSGKINSLWDKELNVLYFVLYGIIYNINKTYFRLINANRRQLNADRISKIISKNLGTGTIFRINSGNGAVVTESYPGDNVLLRLTSKMVPQASSTGPGRRSRVGVNDPSILFHASVLMPGTHNVQPKSAPEGHHKINPFTQIDRATGAIIIPDDLKVVLNYVQSQIAAVGGQGAIRPTESDIDTGTLAGDGATD
jgi:hypothetical protein